MHHKFLEKLFFILIKSTTKRSHAFYGNNDENKFTLIFYLYFIPIPHQVYLEKRGFSQHLNDVVNGFVLGGRKFSKNEHVDDVLGLSQHAVYFFFSVSMFSTLISRLQQF